MNFGEHTKWKTVLMTLGAIMMVAGAVTVIIDIGNFMPYMVRAAAVIAYAVGTVVFAVMQAMQTYSSVSLTITRLRRIMLIGDACFVTSGLLALEQTFQIVMPWVATTVDGYADYCHYVHNNWVVLLLIATIIELYVTMRLSYELKK